MAVQLRHDRDAGLHHLERRSDSRAAFTQSRTRPTTAAVPTTITGASARTCSVESSNSQATPKRREDAERPGDPEESAAHARDYPFAVSTEPNYWSGEDYVVEFLGYRFGFNGEDFEQRVTAAAVKLGLLEGNELDEDETADLVELAADGVIQDARSGLGRYLVRHWERVSLVEGESLVYWLRKLVFRGAWLDHRVKEGLLEVAFDDAERRVRLPRSARRPGAARARARAVVARAAVQALDLLRLVCTDQLDRSVQTSSTGLRRPTLSNRRFRPR